VNIPVVPRLCPGCHQKHPTVSGRMLFSCAAFQVLVDFFNSKTVQCDIVTWPIPLILIVVNSRRRASSSEAFVLEFILLSKEEIRLVLWIGRHRSSRRPT
jgi:hypothetical protein